MDSQQYRPNYLDLPISFFPFDLQRNTFANVPTQVTTLRRINTTAFYRKPIEAIRAEPDTSKQDEMKKQQPAITPVALLRHRKKDTTFDEKIIQQWPLLMGDVDQKDNPGIDMAELKEFISSLPYVLLCAYSVRGGLWFVVRLPDEQTPETLAAHFRYLQRLFSEKFGIILDPSKGANPTALRFVSFDAEPYLNDGARAMRGTYTPPPPKVRPYFFDSSGDEDSSKLLKRVVRLVENAGEGERHSTLLRAAKLVGGFVAANRLDEQTAALALETVVSEWPQFSKSQKTIRDGIRFGIASPLPIQVQEKRQWTVGPRKTKKPVDRAGAAPQPETYTDDSWRSFDYSVASVHTQLDPKPVVTTIAEQLANPGSVFKPGEDQLERFIEEPCEDYPAVFDEPNPPGAIPQIREIKGKQSFYEWQCQDQYFSQLGLASIGK